MTAPLYHYTIVWKEPEAAAETWRRLWGDGKIFHGPKFQKDGLGEK